MINYQWSDPLAFELYDLDDDGIDEILTADYSETFLTSTSNRLTIQVVQIRKYILKYSIVVVNLNFILKIWGQLHLKFTILIMMEL